MGHNDINFFFYRTGYTGGSCQDNIDECTDTPDICGDHGECSDLIGSYSCECDDGYVWSNTGACVCKCCWQSSPSQ